MNAVLTESAEETRHSAGEGAEGPADVTAAAVTAVTATDAGLLARFQPIFDRIRTGALEREETRRLPHEEIGWLRDAGFGRVRLPEADGGYGASVEQLVLLLIRLGAADSNIVQALRGHIGFTEFVLAQPPGAYRSFWLAELADGALVGNAESERTGTFATQGTTVSATPDGRLALTGTKYYTTGSIFADWILVSTAVAPEVPGVGKPGEGAVVLATVLVRADAPGVRIHDDWDGFGQRLTGSGTTDFTDVEVDARFLLPRTAEPTVQHAVYQLVHLAALAGIGAAALEEIAAFVRGRSRNLFNPSVPPSQDPISLQIIGEAFGTVQTVEATVLAAARSVQVASVAAADPRAGRGPAQGSERAAGADAAALGLLVRADAHVFGVQPTVIGLVLGLVSRIFEVGGASATSTSRHLDRLWRNARTVSSHNPAIYRQQVVGDFVINGTPPGEALLRLLTE